jgi:hypothetical protein
VRLAEHGVGFANTGGSAEENLKATAFSGRFGSLNVSEYFVRVWSILCQCSNLSRKSDHSLVLLQEAIINA